MSNLVSKSISNLKSKKSEQKSFWNKLKDSNQPILVLAPMEDVTDTVFRRMVINCGKPAVMFTEFTSCEGVQSVGQAKVIHRLRYTEVERPIVAQIWGVTPEDYFKTAKLVLELGFDGIDINMGCPVKKIIKQGACSALIKNPNLAKEIFLATKEGVKNQIPMSIKTRIGFGIIQTEEWCGFLLKELKPDVLIVHGRTVKEESKPPNHWEEIAKTVQIRNQIQENLNQKTLIIGNGDITSYQQAINNIDEFELDGIMIGRGVFQNLWIFNQELSTYLPSFQERIELLKKHINLWVQEWGKEEVIKNYLETRQLDNNLKSQDLYIKNYNILKKYFKIYISGFSGASEFREKLVQTKNHVETLQLLENWTE